MAEWLRRRSAKPDTTVQIRSPPHNCRYSLMVRTQLSYGWGGGSIPPIGTLFPNRLTAGPEALNLMMLVRFQLWEHLLLHKP